MTDNNTTTNTSKNATENKKSKIRMLLESLESEIHISWLRDTEKINELQELNKILTSILNSESIEVYFQNDESDFEYFIKKFSKETITNILRQHFIIGENGDEVGLEILGNYLKIFIKFMNKPQYLPLWESVKDIFDYNKPFYKGTGYNAVLAKIESHRQMRKQITSDKYNELFLTQKPDRFALIQVGEEIDILHENKKPYASNVKSELYWTRAKIKDINGDYFFVNLAEEETAILMRKTSLNYAKKGAYTKDYEWRMNLKAGDVIECLDRGKFYPATIIERFEELRNGMTFASYRVGFRLYPGTFADWVNYRNFWPSSALITDSQNNLFYGDKETLDEHISFFSNRIQKLGTHEGKIVNNVNKNNDFESNEDENSSKINEKDEGEENEAFCVDDYVVFDLEDNEKQININVNNNEENKVIRNEQETENFNINTTTDTKLDQESESDISKFRKFLEITKSKLNSYKKTYVIAKSQSFSFYYAQLISEFASCGSYQKMLNLLHKSNPEKPNPELIYFIFLFFGYSSTILHKEFLKLLSSDMKENVIGYLNSLSEKDLRNIKKETIDIIIKVLQYYLSFSMTAHERNLIIENFSISFSLKMLKSSLLDKRISAVKNIVDIIKNANQNKQKTQNLLEIIEEHKIFHEIFGPNSHIQLINRSKSLLEIMLSENKLSGSELELIWEATKKGDLEAKLTVLKLLEEISLNLRDHHVQKLLEHVYLSEPENLIKEEVDLLYELATHYTQSQTEITRMLDFFLKALLSGKIDDNEEKMQILIDKVFYILKNQYLFGIKNNLFTEYIANILVENVSSLNMKISFVSLRILKLLIKDFPELYTESTEETADTNTENEEDSNPTEEKNNDKEKIVKKPFIDLTIFIRSFVNNFEEYRKQVRSAIKAKNWTKDIDSLAIIDNFSYSKNIRKRLGIISALIFRKIWVFETDPICLVFKFLIEDAISEKDNLIFYEWIKYLLNSEKLSYESETNIFNLFNTQICSDNKKCQNLSIQGFESYLKIFLDINKKNNLLDFFIEKNQEEINLFTTPENLLGFEILWKIIFESFSSEIMNRGIQILHLLYSNKNATNDENLSEVLLRKCIDLIKETILKQAADEEKLNVIVKCLFILRLMIEESEKKGTAGIKSHSGLIKNKVININVSSYIQRVDDFKLKLYANTTLWELKEIIAKKTSIALDFLKLKINQEIVSDSCNGKTIVELNLSDGSEIDLYMNKLSDQIPKAELVLEKGKTNPRLLEILNEWFTEYSDDEGKMTREFCAKFVKDVTNTQENIQTNDHRISFLFESYDLYKENYIPREGFIMFYSECLKSREKIQTVWDNLHNMGIRNDLRKIEEGLGNSACAGKHSLPRFKLAHNAEFFETIFSLMKNSNKKLAKEAFDFLLVISTNPEIYRKILNADSKDSLAETLDAGNVYKLVYSLQIIESFLEDIEIEKEDVDSFGFSGEFILSEEENQKEKREEDLKIEGSEHLSENQTNKKIGNSIADYSDLKEKKIKWMKNFIENEGFEFLLNTVEEKLENLTNAPKQDENGSINKISVLLSLKIIKIFYNSSLNKFQINKDVNKLVKIIKKTSTLQSSFGLNESLGLVSDPAKAEENLQDPLQLKSLHSAATFNDKENENQLNEFNKLNSNTEINLEKKASNEQINSKQNPLEKVFEGVLGDKIISAIQASSFTEKLFKLLISFDLKSKVNNNFKQNNGRESKSIAIPSDLIASKCDVEVNLTNEDIEIVQNAFEILCCLISFNNDNHNESAFNINQKIVISDEKQKKEFSELCLFSLINPEESIRQSSALALIRLTKLLSLNSNFDILASIFNEIFSFLLPLDNSSKVSSASSTKESNKADINNANNAKNDLNLTHLFEFFAFIYEIYFSHKNSFEISLHMINPSFKASPAEDFIYTIAQSIEDDLKSNKAEMQLRNEIFIGYIKILSKVAENNLQIKNEISEKFNLIQEIMTKLLFKQSDKSEFSLLRKDSIQHNNNNNYNDADNNGSHLEFVNPDSFSDLKSTRRKSQVFRNACYKFILSMLKNSVKNFEKFFAINILEDESNNSSNNLTKKFSINSQNNLNVNGNNDSDLNKTNSNNNLSRQNSNSYNNINNINNYKKYPNFKVFNYTNNNATKAFGHVGLRNLGCICYMNSMLQQFFMVPSFRRALLQTEDKLPPDCNNAMQVDDNAFHQVQRMFAYLSFSNREEFNPEAFCFSFKDYEGNPTNTAIQQDAQEFLSRFMDKIEYSLKPTQFKYLVHSVFGGKICSQLCCENCNTTKKRFEDMFFLSLSVSNLKTIYESLEKFISVEKIDEYNCDTCAKKVTIAKRNVLADLPNVLIIHLQRIYYNYETDRNEKINSRLEFPKVLNLKDYTLEEIEKQNYLRKNNLKETDLDAEMNGKGAEESEGKTNNGYPFESDEVYFKNDEYYEYHLVGVNVHIGSADAGHYFSYINKLRNGEGHKMSYDPQVQDEKDLWLKFNDSTISKFNIEKLEEECFGGKMDNSETEQVSSWNFRNSESIQSAYMLVYERRLKNPIKYLVPAPIENSDSSASKEINNSNADNNNSGISNLITYKDEEEKAIAKEYNLHYNYGKPDFAEKSHKIFNSIFYDNAKNEYYKYIPFFAVENLVPLNYYTEIIEDNNRLEKQQNISDEQFALFFETVINLLDDAVHNNSTYGEEEAHVNNILRVFVDFIFNILSSADKIKLLVTAQNKLIRIIEKSPSRLNAVIDYLNENHEKIFKYILNDDIYIVRVHCAIVYEVIANIANLNFDLDFIDEDNFKAQEHKAIKAELIEKAKKLIDFVLFLFPKIPAKKISNISPLLYKIRDLCNLSYEMLKYFASKEVVFIFITFMLGRDSPHYQDTLTYQGENWDYCRNANIDPDPIVQMVYSIFKKSNELKSGFKSNQKAISFEENNDPNDQEKLNNLNNDNNTINEQTLNQNDIENYHNDSVNNNENLLSERDLNCIKNANFLKLAFKSNKKFYSEFIKKLSKNDKEFSIQCCTQLTQFIDDVLMISENEIIEIINCVVPLLEIQDENQLLRFCIVLGYPQMIIDEATVETKFANLGFHSMADAYSKIIEVKNSVNVKNSTCLMKKVFDCYSKDTVFIEIFLALIKAAVGDLALLKYLRSFTCEDYIGEDFISLGITKIKDYCQRHKDKTYFDRLREAAVDLNDLLSVLNSAEGILIGFKGFLGKFLNKAIKRQTYSLIYSEDNLSIFKIEYFTNIIETKDVVELDFSNSKAFKKQNNAETEGSEIELESEQEANKFAQAYPAEEIYLYDIDILEYNENEFLKKMLPLVAATGKQIVVNTKENVENYSCNVIRYLALNESNADAKVTLRVEKKNIAASDESNSINEFIPEGDIITDISGYSHKNLLVLSKIDPNLPWSFEQTSENNKSELLLEHLISVEFEEQKLSYYPNTVYRTDYNDLLKHYQYQKLDFEQFGAENTRSDDCQFWDEEEKM